MVISSSSIRVDRKDKFKQYAKGGVAHYWVIDPRDRSIKGYKLRRGKYVPTGAGRAQSDSEGYYKFVTIKPGAYPWGNHHNAWRPAHIHFSVFGHSFVSRLVTQMYFPGDPLFPFDPIFNSVTDEKARLRMISAFDLENTKPEWALCYRFDIVLRGRNATPMETK